MMLTKGSQRHTHTQLCCVVCKIGGGKSPDDRVIDGKDLSDVLFKGSKSEHRCLFHYKGSPSTGLPPKEDDPQPGLWAIRCGAYKAHFVTLCAVMQDWGDSRCGTGKAQAKAFALFKECQKDCTPITSDHITP